MTIDLRPHSGIDPEEFWDSLSISKELLDIDDIEQCGTCKHVRRKVKRVLLEDGDTNACEGCGESDSFTKTNVDKRVRLLYSKSDWENSSGNDMRHDKMMWVGADPSTDSKTSTTDVTTRAPVTDSGKKKNEKEKHLRNIDEMLWEYGKVISVQEYDASGWHADRRVGGCVGDVQQPTHISGGEGQDRVRERIQKHRAEVKKRHLQMKGEQDNGTAEGGNSVTKVEVMLKSAESEIIRFLQHGNDVDDKDLEELEDKHGNPPFSYQQREEWYSAILPELDEKEEFQAPIYRQQRTQSAVNAKWRKEVRPVKCCTLLLWLSFLLLGVVVFWDSDGVFETNSFLFQKSFEECLVRDVFDGGDLKEGVAVPGINTFADIQSIDDWWTWANSIMLDTVYREGQHYRDSNNTLRQMPPGSLNALTYSIGRPRLRQIRMPSHKCIGSHKMGFVALDEAYASASNNTCFRGETQEMRNFTTTSNDGKSTTYEYDDEPWGSVLGPWSVLSSFTVLDGGGYVQVLPEKKEDAEAALKAMQEGKWIDLNTRAVFFEFSGYNINENMFIAGRTVLEFDTTGAIRSWWNFDTAKIKQYVTRRDLVRFVGEVLFVLFAAYWVFEEIRQCGKCRRYQGIVAKRRRVKGDENGWFTEISEYLLSDFFNFLDFLSYACIALYTGLHIYSSSCTTSAIDAAVAHGVNSTNKFVPEVFVEVQFMVLMRILMAIVMFLMVVKSIEHFMFDFLLCVILYVVINLLSCNLKLSRISVSISN